MDNYGLIGEKLSHSFSKIVHEQFFGYDYSLFELPKGAFDSFMIQRKFKGINITIPYKQVVMPFLDSIDEKAKTIGAVNTVINKNGRLFGYNTDYYGVLYTLKKVDIDVKNKNVLILGNGGTTKTIKSVLTDLGAKNVLIASRNPVNGALSYEQCLKSADEISVIFNASPVGMYPNSNKIPIDLRMFKNIQGVVDAVYNPLRTRFLQQAQSLSIKNIGGLYMLCTQAKFAAEYFLDQKIDDQKIDDIYNALQKRQSNLVLIGMPGCGKSHFGYELSKRMKRKYIDTDMLVVREANRMPVAQIFEQYGEKYFRAVETKMTKQAASESGVIISTGGGTVLSFENVLALKQNGVFCFIDRPLEKLAISDERPLASDRVSIEKLAKERRGIYEKYADIYVMNDGIFEKVMDKLVAEFDKYFIC